MKEQQGIEALVVGGEYFGFEVKRIQPLQKLDLTLVELVHTVTGAKMIHLANEDSNNLFGVAFPTTPQDSTGVAHILEHTALCGSKNFPVRDPFFSMIKRSMNSFMNAFTASDWTMYPFASQIPKDFYNLMDVYLDAAFFPQLTEMNFSQEGHRIEFETPEDPSSPLQYKGVVYNEMKGSMSQPSSILHGALGEALFPTLTYKNNSGGDPSDILNLSWDDLKKFHQTHYHPSNAYFYTYGNLPLLDHLEKIEGKVLSDFTAIETNTAVGRETRYSEPQKKEVTYPLSKEEDDGASNQFLVAWLTCDILEPLELLALQLVNMVLLGSSSSPLRMALLESNLGKALADGTGFEDDIRETWFAVGLQGVADDNLKAVEDLIYTSINDIIKNGISEEEVEAALHQMELDTREISGGHFPYSLNLLFRFFGPWMHGGDPVQALDFDASLVSLKEALQEPNYLVNKMQEYFVDNPHRVTLTVKPDHEQAQREASAEKEKLEEVAKNLSEEEKKAVVERGIALEKQQEEVEDLSCLPNLKIEDIPKTLEVCKPTELNWEGLGIDFYEQPTNGVFYSHWTFSLPTLTLEEQKWLPLLGTLIPATGAGDLDYAAMSRRISLHTGGFSLGVNLSKLAQSQDYRNEFSLKSKALDSKIPELFTIAKELLLDWRLDEETRIQSLVKQKSSSLSNSVLGSGHQYAASLAMRNLTSALKIDELQSGVTQVQFLKDLSKLEPSDLLKAIEPFKKLLRRIIVKENLSLFTVGSKEAWELAKPEIKRFLSQLPSGEKAAPITLDLKIENPFQKEVWFTTTPVSYVAKSFPAPTEKDPLSPKFLVMANLVKSSFLHGEIREKGGAYGGMASFQAIEGALTFLSYRDPHVARTISVYDRALDWVKNGEFTDENLEEAIRITMSNLDTPLSPAGKAIRENSHHKRGKQLAERQKYRTGILDTTRGEILEAASKWLQEPSAVATITSKDIFEKEKPELTLSLDENQI